MTKKLSYVATVASIAATILMVSGATATSQQMPGQMPMSNGWSGGGMWIWTVIGVLVIVLLVVVISKQSKK